jgi:hypothetical protein
MPAYDPFWGQLKVQWAGKRARRSCRAVPAVLIVDVMDEMERLMARGDASAVLAASEALAAITRIRRSDAERPSAP